MGRYTNVLLRSAALAIILAAGGAHAAPMPQADFDAAVKEYDDRFAEARKGGLKLDDAIAIQLEFTNRFPIADLTVAQLATLQQRGLITGYRPDPGLNRSEEAMRALDAHMKSAGPDAVKAHMLAADILSRAGEEQKPKVRDHVVAILKHPSLAEAARGEGFSTLWYLIAYELSAADRVALVPDLQDAAQRFPTDAAATSLSGLTVLYEAAASSDNPAFKDAAETLRVKAVDRLTAILADASPDTDTRMAKRELDNLVAAPKIASLVGSTAPELDFVWTTRGESLSSLADLRGKVVILDFWATWCGPCVATFPQVRDLVAHYKGYPVEVVGVTSVQGATHFKAGAENAENPEQEYEQMTRYIDERDITWTVGFTTQNVFNPDYGVRGIPHVVILDPAGKIRHRALHPASPLSKKAALIDPILEEFGMSAPAAPVEPEAEPKGGN